MLDLAGEYHVDPAAAMLRFFPPEGSDSDDGSYHVSRLQSVIVATGTNNPKPNANPNTIPIRPRG